MTDSTPSARTAGGNRYGSCAKCGGGNDRRAVPGAYVSGECKGTPGHYRFCAVGGGRFPDGESLDWVCYAHHHTSGRPDSDPCGELEGRLYDIGQQP